MPQETVRIFVNQTSLKAKQELLIEEKSHYLFNVMRLRKGDEIIIFNGIDGDWLAQITQAKKDKTSLYVKEKIKSQDIITGQISLAFSLPKRQVLSDIAKQGTELGINKFYPIISKRSSTVNFNEKSFFANIIEACQQCKRNSIPQIANINSFVDFTANFHERQSLIICDESGGGDKDINIVSLLSYEKENIVVVGPEGGFSQEEFQIINDKKLIRMDLGKNILRVSTACVSAITLIKSYLKF